MKHIHSTRLTNHKQSATALNDKRGNPTCDWSPYKLSGQIWKFIPLAVQTLPRYLTHLALRVQTLEIQLCTLG